MAARSPDPARGRLIRLVHVGKGKLGLSDEAYAALLEGAAGKRSSSEMTVPELEAVLRALRAAGFIPTGAAPGRRLAPRPQDSGGPGMATSRQVYYMKGLWSLMSREKDEDSLKALVKRIAGVDDLRFVPKSAASAVILALRDIAGKAGYDPDGPRGR